MEAHCLVRWILIVSTLSVSVCSADTALETKTKTKTKTKTVEDDYVERFGNDPAVLIGWFRIRNWWYMPGEASLRKYCAEIHELAGLGKHEVDFVLFRHRWLNFKNPFYTTRQVDVVEYSLSSPKRPAQTTEKWTPKKGGRRWYITQGIGPGCAFTLRLVNKENMEFMLHKHVCGIQDINPFTLPDLEEVLKTVSPFSGGTGMYSHERALGTPGEFD